MFYQHLIVILASVDSYVIKKYKNHSDLTKSNTQVFSKVFKTWLGFPFYMWRSLDETLNIFMSLGLFKNSAEKLDLQFSIGQA